MSSKFATNLVEKVHHEEGLEDDGVKSHTIGWQLRDGVNQRSFDEIKWFFEENENAEVHKDHGYDDLISSLSQNVPPIACIKNLLSLSDSSAHPLFFVGFCTKLNGTQYVHHNIDPKHLNHIQRRRSECQTSYNSQYAQRNVGSKLIL